MRSDVSLLLMMLGCCAVGGASGFFAKTMLAGPVPQAADIAPPIVKDDPRARVSGWVSEWRSARLAAAPMVPGLADTIGLFDTDPSHIVLFSRARDDEGRAFRAGCSYVVAGLAQSARAWSLTLYDSRGGTGGTDGAGRREGGEDILDRAISSADVPGEAWRILIGPTRPGRYQWLSSDKAGDGFRLLFRLYGPSQKLASDPADHFAPPSVTRASCEGAS